MIRLRVSRVSQPIRACRDTLRTLVSRDTLGTLKTHAYLHKHTQLYECPTSVLGVSRPVSRRFPLSQGGRGGLRQGVTGH